VCSLNISSVADAQMEGLRYRVSNREQDFTLQFYCTDFETSVNEQLTQRSFPDVPAMGTASKTPLHFTRPFLLPIPRP